MDLEGAPVLVEIAVRVDRAREVLLLEAVAGRVDPVVVEEVAGS